MNKLKKIKLKDIFGIILFVIALIPSVFLKVYNKMRKKNVWLICERENMARDNGLAFFQYMTRKHKEIKVFYAIEKNCSDYNKLNKYNNIIEWGSLKHYIIYMSANWNISSHKEGNPNHALFTILHLYLHLYNNRVFLQHGILYTNLKMFHYKNTFFKIFICGARKEYEYVNKIYGYTNNQVKFTGLARFDNLYSINKSTNDILYIPTWRRQYDTKEKFENSKYFKRIMSLINNDNLNTILKESNQIMYLYLHTGVEKYNELYKTNSTNIKIVSGKQKDIQLLLKQCALMITDYSSVASDFAYIDKSIIYYQYDKEAYNEHIGSELSYFNYHNDGFGIVIENEKELINEIKRKICDNYKIEKKYEDRINEFYGTRDNLNCERIFSVISQEK